jgi:hypothetical protein
VRPVAANDLQCVLIARDFSEENVHTIGFVLTSPAQLKSDGWSWFRYYLEKLRDYSHISRRIRCRSLLR